MFCWFGREWGVGDQPSTRIKRLRDRQPLPPLRHCVNVIQAWEEIYASQYGRLVTLMTALSGSVADAEEAVQEAFARGLGLPGRRPPPQDPAAWLYRVAANVVRGKWRRALAAHRHRGEVAVEPQAASAVDHADDGLMLLAAMR
jgi:DNA-directed RNA polymerase specialized sigma24 family protein